MTARTNDIHDIHTALRAQAGALDLEPEEARLFLHVLRELAQGQPVAFEQVDEFARQLDLPPERARETLRWLAELSDDGRIAGLAGLSTKPWNHGFSVGGRRLSTWCALDTLFLPPLLRQTAEVDSQDPYTQEPIRVRVSPNGVLGYTPDTARLSIVIPRVETKGLQSAEQIWNAFCSYSHFFEAEASARAWFEGKGLEPVILRIDEGFELGRRWFESVGRHA